MWPLGTEWSGFSLNRPTPYSSGEVAHWHPGHLSLREVNSLRTVVKVTPLVPTS